MKLPHTFIRYKNHCLKLLGLIFVALGIVGILLPVMPTTIFFILALACFTRSSPQLEHWLLHHPTYGTPLQQWQEYRVVPTKAKVFAATGMTLGVAVLIYSATPLWVIAVVVVVEIMVMLYLLSRPSSPP